MPRHITKLSRIEAAGNKPKLIDEIFGHVNSGSSDISVAHMRSPGGWVEPGQTPDFDEYTYVLKGEITVEHKTGKTIVKAGEAIMTNKGEWVRYSTPGKDGAEYIAVCKPAFSPDNVHRDE